ncbi:unnamed protein product [Hydatigera taeniaeformis]|uniref:Uncharacterized protein n=1 Tax=Hydatigena taeniaeformis TaxID=6205 RepID=A0A0R3XDM9_HYDTA|nr:unnamed protein product [Hydatigera taeniaeformis]
MQEAPNCAPQLPLRHSPTPVLVSPLPNSTALEALQKIGGSGQVEGCETLHSTSAATQGQACSQMLACGLHCKLRST